MQRATDPKSRDRNSYEGGQMPEIIDDKHLEDIDRKDLSLFLDSERSMYLRLVERKMITPEQLHDLTWKSVEAVTASMGAVEIFALLAAIARRARRYGDMHPFREVFSAGFGGWLADQHKDGEEIEDEEQFVDVVLRRYVRDALWYLLDQHLIATGVWRRTTEIAATKEAA
jgi:hypothetical protein